MHLRPTICSSRHAALNAVVGTAVAASFSIPRACPDFHEVIFPESAPPEADAILAQQRETVCLQSALTRFLTNQSPIG